jgi:AcrR family transcriptional regulator
MPVSPKVGVAPVRRDAIVGATIRCLARDGYARLTMKRVAADAGVAPGILHYYFRDKRAILAAAADRVTKDLDRRVAAEARGARDAWARLRGLIRACLAAATRDREAWTVFIAFWGEALHDRELALLNARAYERARRLIAAGIARGVAEGEFRRLDPAEAGAVILALLDGLSLQLRFEDGNGDARGDRSDRERRRRGRRPLARAARLAEEALVRYLSPHREEARRVR